QLLDNRPAVDQQRLNAISARVRRVLLGASLGISLQVFETQLLGNTAHRRPLLSVPRRVRSESSSSAAVWRVRTIRPSRTSRRTSVPTSQPTCFRSGRSTITPAALPTGRTRLIKAMVPQCYNIQR